MKPIRVLSEKVLKPLHLSHLILPRLISSIMSRLILYCHVESYLALVSRRSSLVCRLSSLVSRPSSLVSRLSSLVSRLSCLVSRLISSDLVSSCGVLYYLCLVISCLALSFLIREAY